MDTPKLKSWNSGSQVVLGSTPLAPEFKGTGDQPLLITAGHPKKAREVADAFLHACQALEKIAAMDNPGAGEAANVASTALAGLHRVMP